MIMENEVLKNKKLDKDLNLKITKDPYLARIHVEFSSEDRKFVLQRSFQNTYFGQIEMENFSKSLKTVQDLKERLGFKTNS